METDTIRKCSEIQGESLRKLCLEGLTGHPELTGDVYRDTLDYELGVISAKGCSDYFLILADLVRKVRERGGIVGPGRGSAAGSLVNYLLGITGLDPVANGLLFERFLNPDSIVMPDIDIDFDEKGRDLACKILKEDGSSNEYDFLSLRTLSVIQETGDAVGIDPGRIPDDDPQALELFGRGDTGSVFQFESAGMREYLRRLGGVSFSDLVAMEAMYRPGPIDLIPEFIERHNGKPFSYPLPGTEDILSETFGILVYQEQLMKIAETVAGFTKGEADILRKAAGKRKIPLLNELKVKFIEGGMANGFDRRQLEEFWIGQVDSMEGCYLFQKSHALCYAHLGYICGYLKAHHRAEYLHVCKSNDVEIIEEQ